MGWKYMLLVDAMDGVESLNGNISKYRLELFLMNDCIVQFNGKRCFVCYGNRCDLTSENIQLVIIQRLSVENNVEMFGMMIV